MSNHLRQQGQAAVEAVGATFLTLVLCVVLLSCCYLGFFKIFSEYLLHEALICAATVTLYSPPENCQKKLVTQMTKIILFQKIESIQWKKSKNSISLSLQVSGWKGQVTSDLGLQSWVLKKSLALPLQY